MTSSHDRSVVRLLTVVLTATAILTGSANGRVTAAALATGRIALSCASLGAAKDDLSAKLGLDFGEDAVAQAIASLEKGEVDDAVTSLTKELKNTTPGQAGRDRNREIQLGLGITLVRAGKVAEARGRLNNIPHLPDQLLSDVSAAQAAVVIRVLDAKKASMKGGAQPLLSQESWLSAITDARRGVEKELSDKNRRARSAIVEDNWGQAHTELNLAFRSVAQLDVIKIDTDEIKEAMKQFEKELANHADTANAKLIQHRDNAQRAKDRLEANRNTGKLRQPPDPELLAQYSREHDLAIRAYDTVEALATEYRNLQRAHPNYLRFEAWVPPRIQRSDIP